jgi:hypothetical protein
LVAVIGISCTDISTTDIYVKYFFRRVVGLGDGTRRVLEVVLGGVVVHIPRFPALIGCITSKPEVEKRRSLPSYNDLAGRNGSGHCGEATMLRHLSISGKMFLIAALYLRD